MKQFSEYDYLQQLVISISSYVEKKIKEDSNYFVYKDVDLRYAFERRVWFDIIKHPYYQNIQQCIANSTVLFVASQTHKDILCSVYDSGHLSIKVTQKVTSIVKNIVLKNKLVMNMMLSLLYRKKTIVNTVGYKFLFVSIHHKFIRYLGTIYEKLSDNSVFIIVSDIEQSISFCKEKGYNYIVLKNYASLVSVPTPDTFELSIVYERLFFLLKQFKNARVILPEGNSHVYELANLASKKLGHKTICIQQGWSPIIHNGFRNMHFDKFLCWGDEFSNLLKPYNQNQKFISVGNHVLEINNDSGQKQECISFFLQAITPLITSEIYNSFIELIKNAAKKYPDKKVIVREHPSHLLANDIKKDLQSCENVIFMNSDKYTLSDIFSISKVSVSIYSTTLIEAMMYNNVALIYNLTSLPKYEPDLGCFGVEVHSFEEATKAIDELIRNDIEPSDLKNKVRYFKATGADALSNIVREISTSC